MSQSKRPRRQAAANAIAIIEISDDEGEETAKRRRRSNSGGEDAGSSRRYRNAENRQQMKQRWPEKNKSSANSDASELAPRKPRAKKDAAAKRTESSENTPPNTEQVAADEANALSQSSRDHPSASSEGNPSGLPTTTGRSSFWARRKVWTIPELLAETSNIGSNAASNIVQLFETENTIPFICRYRRDLVDHITPERLREIKNTYSEIVGLRKKAENIVQQLAKENSINDEVRTEMMCAKTAEELEFLYAPYKPASKGSLADRAKALGLETHADRLLYGDAPPVVLEKIVDVREPGLDNVEKVLSGISHIISHTISKHTGVLEQLRQLQKVHRVQLKCSKAKAAAAPKANATAATKANTSAASKLKPLPKVLAGKAAKNDASKYELYFDFQADTRNLKPHQVLAINRGEKSKFLTVKLVVPDHLKLDIKRFIRSVFMEEGLHYPLRQEVFEKSFEECYAKKLQPLLTRQIRADLNEMAKKASIDVFARNLKQLLLMSPLKGERILGIDPGFTNGCKLALISATADVLETGVLYVHTRDGDREECGHKLSKMLARHNCKIIALGNGTACRETEFWLTQLFDLNILDAKTVRYSIVSEQGASIYSCSEVARKEFPTMDANEISAVSIARRLNDPLSEYVKIEPRHIGVGMYQHDVQEKTLTESLNEVVSECVSYVGVDLNTASLSVLRHIAGLTEKRAEKIIEHRSENGPFRSRKDLLEVKSIGQKTFTQCAGFVRIEPRSLGGRIANLLDCTWVHPESYLVAKKIISNCKLNLDDIGTADFIDGIKTYAREGLATLAADFKMPIERLEVVLSALQRPLFQDYRADFDKRPLFKKGVTRLKDLSEGEVVTGAVTNVTHFGAFVDIGVECDGLIHSSKIPRGTQLNIGDMVTASVVGVDVKRQRIGLRLEKMLVPTDNSFTFG